ncbi:hypothetical protein DPMN_068737 [Dreissena polymorpha]|uniref:Uncharacterized protein n=1 Tax=Dreissena polymorpha TaxID=45954 RepID=A0A9D3YXR3_DREPO|nr:hypothetical protein DPMN_068737 [Dreissena polymorpha]
MVSSIITEVTGGIQTIITSLQNENEAHRIKVKDLEKQVDTLEKGEDKYNQYIRRNCLRLSGVTEQASENIETSIYFRESIHAMMRFPHKSSKNPSQVLSSFVSDPFFSKNNSL